MDERQKSRAAGWCAQAPVSGEWRLARLDVISAIDQRQWPVARIELHHRTRGRVFEIATGAGGMDAIFNALAQHFGIEASVAALSVQFEPGSDSRSTLPQFIVTAQLLVGEMIYRGIAKNGDMLLSTAAAYLDALARAHAHRKAAEARQICQNDFELSQSEWRAA